MNIETHLQGRLQNGLLPLSNGLLPLFEAVVNSIHAIEYATDAPEQGKIRVAINRAEVISFDRLVNAAKERNRAFFDRLGLPTK